MRDRASGAPPAWPYTLLLMAWLTISVLLSEHVLTLLQAGGGPALAMGLGAILLGECVGAFYLLGFIAKSVWYLWERPIPVPPPGPDQPAPAVAVLYLTAGDFDAEAVDSLLRLRYDGPRLFVLHDDGSDPAVRARMRAQIDRHPNRDGWRVAVWHRPVRAGGKAGAVNWVVGRLDRRWQLLLLCDSDSMALEPDALMRAVHEFADHGVAVVQFRNVGHAGPEEGPLQRRLAHAIDVFDAFASPQAAWGYLPFFGHNALLRIADLRRLGGLTPGFFSDDLDYSVRLTLAGQRIVYRRDICFGERHPADWRAFRKRARKWAVGCMQVVRRRARAVITTRGIPFAHRVGMLEFMGFYPAQALVVTALLVAHLALPWLASTPRPGPEFAPGGGLVVLALLAPTLAWSLRERQLAAWPALAWSCVMVYGGSILATARGVLQGLSGRERPWVPTNLAEQRPAVPREGWTEALLGLLLVAVPWLTGSPLLAFPPTYLFVATLLFSPLTFATYREAAGPAGPVRPRRTPQDAVGVRGAAAALLLVALSWGGSPAAASARPEAAPRLSAAGDRLLLDGRPFRVRAVHYSPWLPGTGPDGRSAYPGPEVVERDLAAIRDLGANAILLHGAPGWVVDRAAAQGLVSLYAFDIAWHDTREAAFERHAAAIVSAVDSLRGHRGLVLWILGHEVPGWVVEQLGAQVVERRLRGLAERVRARDGARLLGHGNWPPAKMLDLSFLDLACFNLYPAWPYEVSVKGFGPYLREVLVPLARGRPLLVTEFGINSLEAGEQRQAEVLANCWREIERSPVAGGVVFEWCDEPWKNFDNPIPGRSYWERAYVPDDALRHDDDPEEHYGLVRTDRTPKLAWEAIRDAWRSREPARAWWPWALLAALGVATWIVFGLGRRGRRSSALASREVASVTALLAMLCLFGRGTVALAFSLSARDTVTGVQLDSQFGWALCGVGDQDADGADDVAVGARFERVGADTAAGAVYVYRGRRPTGWPPLIRLEGLSDHEHFGESLVGDHDVDGDGRADLAVGAPRRSSGGRSSNGAVDVFRGGALPAGRWTTLAGEASDDWFGQSVALGDLDGDGKAELVVGAPYNDRVASAGGAVFIYRGGAQPPLAAWVVLTGEAAHNHFGWSVACPGDVDGDGYGDVVVGARLFGSGLSSARGKVYLYRGGPAMSTTPAGSWLGEARDDWFGNSVAGPGDVDGGGRHDVLVGAPYNDRGGSAAGAAYLFRGEDPVGSPPAAVYVGETANAQFGWSVARGGDADGDGRPDVLVGARLQPVGGLAAAGRIYLFSGGAPLSTTPLATADGEAANDWFGNAVAGAGSYFADVLAAASGGAPYNDAAASAAGRAYVLGGASAVGVVDGGRAAWGVPWVFPNPAAGALTVRWAGTARGFEVVDLAGRRLRRLPAHASREGVVAAWDARDEEGRRVAPGVYFVRVLNAGALPAPAGAVRVSVLR